MDSKTLEARFTRFLDGLPAAESIDRLQLPDDGKNRRKADYLLANRKVIVEIKTLTDDPSHKVETLGDQHRTRGDWPLFYGKANVRKVLSNLSDGDAIYKRLVNALGRSVETVVRSAEEQVTHTRRALDLPDAAGVLLILNDSIEILDPYVVGHRVAQLLRRPRTGKSEAEKLDFVCLCFECHSVGAVEGRPAAPFMLIDNDIARRFPWFKDFHHDLVQKWAVANGGVSGSSEISDASELKFMTMRAALEAPPAQLPRHEWWRREYRAHPYLRSLRDEHLLQKGSDIMRRTLPHFVEGGPGYVEDVVLPLMEEFTHFLEEMNFRGLDMRRVPRP
ncbi:hypothetical protein [Mitsuaria sp. BK037]|uniref:hypothetical protein n=1 Tax=Mitsuaria sp. BK037 TaxID=2587122 RepID=UPI00160CF523|nr:hypothetical protein [Mitsuaria sp. BK037]MBB3284231.1 hypothetical protein [Mitsuaria sp. BK037]